MHRKSHHPVEKKPDLAKQRGVFIQLEFPEDPPLPNH